MRKSLCVCILLLSVCNLLAAEPEGLRLMTYNIHHAEGMDGRLDCERIARVLLSKSPYCVAVQEIDSATARVEGLDILQKIAGNMKMFPVFSATMPYLGGKYGIGLLCKEKPIAVHHVPLPGREEVRMLLIAEFERFCIGCTHFSLTQEDRKLSVERIRGSLKIFQKPFFLMGDMNMQPDDSEADLLSRDFICLSGLDVKTFPADSPTDCIDYIWGDKKYKDKYNVLETEVVIDTVASDHRPVYVRLSVE